jgi:hypothetical protein
MSITDELERAIGHGPANRPVQQTVAAGRRALRRRRAATAVAGLAVVGVLGGTWAGAGAGTWLRGGEVGVATSPSPTGDAETENEYAGEEPPAHFSDTGELVLRSGVTVVREVDNPMGYEAPKRSVGLVLDDAGTRIWALLEDEPRGAASVYDDARQTFPTFDLWLADAVAVWKGEPTLALVRFAEGTSLVADDEGVEVIDQRANPDLPRSFAGPDEQTAVAEVTWHGDTWFVLARRLPGYDAEYFPTAASIVGDPGTIDEFLVVARERYDNGDGLR